MDLWINILAKAFWSGWAALGFCILFNTPRVTFISVWMCGFIAGLLKFCAIEFADGGVILATLLGSSAVGFMTIPIAHKVHTPPIIVSIPAVIPLVPGSFAYRTMLGLIRFIQDNDADVLTRTVHNGVMTLFIILAISIGVTLPMLIFRLESVKNLRIRSPLR